MVALALALLGTAARVDAATYAGVAGAPGVVWISGGAPAPRTDASIREVVRTVARHTGATVLLLRRLVACLLAGAGLISPVLL